MAFLNSSAFPFRFPKHQSIQDIRNYALCIVWEPVLYTSAFYVFPLVLFPLFSVYGISFVVPHKLKHIE